MALSMHYSVYQFSNSNSIYDPRDHSMGYLTPYLDGYLKELIMSYVRGFNREGFCSR